MLVPAGLSNVTAVAAGGYHSLALQADGTVVGWGAGTQHYGQTNFGQAWCGLSNVVAVAGGAVSQSGVEGRRDGGGVGCGREQHRFAAGLWAIRGPGGLEQRGGGGGGGYHSLALKADGTVVAWGWHDNAGQNYGQHVPGGVEQRGGGCGRASITAWR